MKERLKKILGILSESKGPVKGKELSELLGVSRQVIVQDISVLKTKGYKIYSTRDGYVLERRKDRVRKMVAVKHGEEEIYDELFRIVSAGGKVIDVIVEHPIYGEITGRLDIETLDDIAKFMALMQSSNATPLLRLSGGVHIHTIETPNKETMKKVLEAISKYLLGVK
ncbi:transcriptional regulator [Thermosipho melanesiensis]|uniref:3H domain protein n=2 Tax=Thermosipho melanesiensis TaxID=46541 RepID=A6LJ67_THEM4|nr:transcription repressor NadR [Thermosipho melanesiensis]ABR29968.1 3H domain protein [Thermosipho melanesiensis BI429]APT73172.1 transcriptional regulator [Thermosipho melanesiensis]OOC38569.1 transcriptional regulator [Thermosipho melanesiensis]OOC40373.1 transcriptional regulator [Thermosipho melanesiensis]OOC40637.1 transcriptional regulator [Thermosipho melanesiensis]